MFECSYCEDSFKSAGALAQHEEYCRKNPENFKPCKVCGDPVSDDDRTYCSYTCSHKDRSHSEETKNKISKSVKKIKKGRGAGKYLKCKKCEEKYYRRPSKVESSRFCSNSCMMKYRNEHNNLARKGGKEAAKVNKEEKRSKNEKYFAELCEEEFDEVLTNEAIFNGWDADVIFPNLKVAVLWNGKWHYEKITENHSVEQVQNRDKIKKKEIKKEGYYPYVIKDMGGFDKKFVEKKFNNFLSCFNLQN